MACRLARTLATISVRRGATSCSLNNVRQCGTAAPSRGLPALRPSAITATGISSPVVPGEKKDEALERVSDDTSGISVYEQPSVPSGVQGIRFKGNIDDDLEGGGARYAPSVGAMWSNIPRHVRDSFKTPTSVGDAPSYAAPAFGDGIISQVKALAASTGLAPGHWQPGVPTEYYGGSYPLAPYRKGQTAAYHYPSVLVPREKALRFPLDMYVDPVFQTGDPDLYFQTKSGTLFPRLQGKITLLCIFSGQPLSGLFTGVQRWLDSVGKEFLEVSGTQVFRMHCAEGWFSRRTHQLTKFHLRRQVEQNELFTTFVYRRKWKWEYVRALHMYDKELPAVLLIDSLGYIRWHAVGLPTEEATTLLRTLSRKLATAKREHA